MERLGAALTERADEGRTTVLAPGRDTALDPDTLDYSYIDPPLRSLVRAINEPSWAMTLGCCAGRAWHDAGNFYILVAVRGIEGLRRFSMWLSLARKAGWEECIDNPSVSAYALPDAELVNSAEVMPDGDWVILDLRFHLGGAQPGRAQTAAGIRALKLGWEALRRGNS
ncbi:MAG: hypothetical protein P8Y85_03840 [Nitrospirota bacterium]|jgi:hypothetical protein